MKRPVPEQVEKSPPVINFPCKPCLANFLYKVHNQDPGTVIEMRHYNVLGIAILERAVSEEAWATAQKEYVLNRLKAHIKVSFPSGTNFYLTDEAIIQINRFLDQWFTEFCASVIIQNKACGIEEKETINLLLQQYDIDGITIDAITKRSQRFRMKLHTSCTLRPIKKRK